MTSHLDYVCKVFSFNVVVSFDEDLSEDGFSDGVVFGIELVKPMECVTVLISKQNQLILNCFKCIALYITKNKSYILVRYPLLLL